MELKKDYFLKLKQKKSVAEKNSYYFNSIAKKVKSNKYEKNRLENRAERIRNCLEYWLWDKYEKNKVLDLKSVSRCKDLFCPNCRMFAVSNAIVNFRPFFKKQLILGRRPYLMTLTIPNEKGERLAKTIEKMNKAFYTFWRWLYYPVSMKDSSKIGFKNRLFDSTGAVKVLEVTTQKNDYNYFHVHFHVILFLENEFKGYFIKDRPGGYQIRSEKYIYYSEADTFIQKLWKLAFDNIKIKEFKNLRDDWQSNYICDIRELEIPGGLYEVFKYCFKDVDIKNIIVFQNLYDGLRNKRLRQGYGELFGLNKLEANFKKDIYEENDDIENYLKFPEEPENYYASAILDMVNDCKDYVKVSRFKKDTEVMKIKD